MATKTKVEIQDYQGNIIFPKTDSELVEYKDSNVSIKLDELISRQKVFIQENEPEDDGLWIDTSSSLENLASLENLVNLESIASLDDSDELENNPIIMAIKKYIDTEITRRLNKI